MDSDVILCGRGSPPLRAQNTIYRVGRGLAPADKQQVNQQRRGRAPALPCKYNPQFIRTAKSDLSSHFTFLYFYEKNKKPDTHNDNQHIKIGFRLWRRARDSNPRSRFGGLHDFQSCSFDQLGQLSSSTVQYYI